MISKWNTIFCSYSGSILHVIHNVIFIQLNHDHEEQRELAATRLAELESTNSKFKESLKEVEKLRMELSTLPEHVVVETTEHKCLQSQFSVLYNENIGITINGPIHLVG